VYSILVWLYLLALIIAAPVNGKARKMLQGRWLWRKKIKKNLKRKQGKRIWFHCASLGEFEMIRPLLDELKLKHPDAGVVISFFSPSGYEYRKDYPCDGVFYLPLDFEGNARFWYRIVQPDIAVFVKYEFWLHYMQQGLKYGSHMVAAGCLFREEQFIFEPWAAGWKRCLQDFNRIFVQNEASAQKAKAEGLRNVSISGDSRFDRVLAVKSEVKPHDVLTTFKGESLVCVAGSSWPAEEKLIQQFIENNGMPVNRKFIIVPHDIGARHIQEIQQRFQVYGCNTLTELEQGADSSKIKILVVDRIGLLNTAYQYADAAIIGGAFGKGLHNMLEAAVWGMPILFGPKHQKFPEAQESIDAGFGFECKDYDAFEKYLKNALGNPEIRSEAALKSQRFVQHKAGATQQVLHYLENLLQPPA
jgi:3-deoxy-D-manno-octulosonic-acid transferase